MRIIDTKSLLVSVEYSQWPFPYLESSAADNDCYEANIVGVMAYEDGANEYIDVYYNANSETTGCNFRVRYDLDSKAYQDLMVALEKSGCGGHTLDTAVGHVIQITIDDDDNGQQCIRTHRALNA